MKFLSIVCFLAFLPACDQGARTLEDEYLLARRQAAFEHSCPVSNVRVIRPGERHDTTDRIVWLDVCDSKRLYRNVGENRNTYIDITNLVK